MERERRLGHEMQRTPNASSLIRSRGLRERGHVYSKVHNSLTERQMSYGARKAEEQSNKAGGERGGLRLFEPRMLKCTKSD